MGFISVLVGFVRFCAGCIIYWELYGFTNDIRVHISCIILSSEGRFPTITLRDNPFPRGWDPRFCEISALRLERANTPVKP